MVEVGASPPDPEAHIYHRPNVPWHNSPNPKTDALGSPQIHSDAPSPVPPDQGCREILTTSGPFTVLVPSLSSRTSWTMNVSPQPH